MENKDIKLLEELNEGVSYKLIIKTKEDVLKTISSNIVDGEVLDDIITKLETSIAKSITERKDTNLPYIGCLKQRRTLASKKTKEIIKAAKENYSRDEYIIFRKQIYEEELLKSKRMSLYKWKLVRAKKKFYDYHLYYTRKYGETFADLFCYFRYTITPIKHISEYILEAQHCDDNIEDNKYYAEE